MRERKKLKVMLQEELISNTCEVECSFYDCEGIKIVVMSEIKRQIILRYRKALISKQTVFFGNDSALLRLLKIVGQGIEIEELLS